MMVFYIYIFAMPCILAEVFIRIQDLDKYVQCYNLICSPDVDKTSPAFVDATAYVELFRRTYTWDDT